jgi:hypothetical protein
LQQSEDGTFIADQAGFDLFPIIFERAAGSPAGANDKTKALITAISHGADWYARAGYQGQAALEPSAALAKYVGEYYSENPWSGTIRVVQRQRQLWMGGTDPLIPIGDHLFRIGAEATSPGVAEFSALIGEKPNFLWIDGVQFRRIEEAA